MAYLNFILLKVNGVDVSQCSHEEAVQVFLSAEEPITVEVKRRSTGAATEELPGSPKRTRETASVGVQTEDLEVAPNLLLLDDDENAVFDESPVSDQVVNIFDELVVPDVDFEEITLQKSSSQEQLGLTVSYIHCAVGSGGSIGGGGGGNNSGGNNSVKSINEVDSEASTEVYISNILPDSLAARDGRLRQGDQILQVNGRDVSDKEETESLFAENKKAVTLLISRYLSIDDYFENSDEMYSDNELWNDDTDEKRLLMDSANATSVTTPPSAVPTKEFVSPKRQATGREKAATPCGGGHDLSKLLYRNDPLHHTKVKAHLESVNNEIQLLDQRMEQLMMNNANKKSEATHELYQDPVDSRPLIPRSNSMVERFSHAKMNHQIVDSESEHIYETIPELSDAEPIYCSPHDSHVDLIRMQQQQQHPQKHQQPVMRWSKSFSAKDRTRSVAKIQKQRLSGGAEDNNCDTTNKQFSSSPFNTTDSGNSNNKFLTLEFCATERAQCQGSTLVLCAPSASGKASNRRSGELQANTSVKKPNARSVRVPNSMSNGHLQPQPGDEKALKGFSASSTLAVGTGGDTMYTNAANLEQTISLQQELFRQSMMKEKMGKQLMAAMNTESAGRQQQQRSKETEHRGRKKISGENQREKALDTEAGVEEEEQRMVWKVKRRPDGSRYIVRRPVQNRRQVKTNALSHGVGGGHELTTEDDTMSEIKLGRYWSKDERKKHMEKAKERRNRQEQVLERKNQTNGAQVAMGEEAAVLTAAAAAVVANGGAKAPKAAGDLGECKDNKIMGLLSVTTV